MDSPNLETLTLSENNTTYTYEALPSVQHIRVLNLKPSLDPDAPLRFTFTVGTLDELEDKYEALSYTWGAPVFPHRLYHHSPANEDSTDDYLKITSNLNDALRKLRRKVDDRCIWADAICIDQGNSSEKNFQIPLMGDIYWKAGSVVAWLGQGDAETEDAMRTILGVSRIQQRQGSIPDEDLDLCCSALLRIVDLGYFRRRWIIQELVMNIDVSFMYGNVIFSWIRFQSAFKIIRDPPSHYQKAKSVRTLSRIITLWNYCMRIHTLPEPDSLDSEATRNLSLLRVDIGVFGLLSSLDSSLCADPRDILYTLATLATDMQTTGTSPAEEEKGDEDSPGLISFGINYADDVPTVFTNFARTAIRSGHWRDIMFALFKRPRAPSTFSGNFPSWVPDWRIPADYDILGQRQGWNWVTLWRLHEKIGLKVECPIMETDLGHQLRALHVFKACPAQRIPAINSTEVSAEEGVDMVQDFWTATAHSNKVRKTTLGSVTHNEDFMRGFFREDAQDIIELYRVFESKNEQPMSPSWHDEVNNKFQVLAEGYSLLATHLDQGWVFFGFTKSSPEPGDRLLIYDEESLAGTRPRHTMFLALLLRPHGMGTLGEQYHLLGTVALRSFECSCTTEHRSNTCGFKTPPRSGRDEVVNVELV